MVIYLPGFLIERSNARTSEIFAEIFAEIFVEIFGEIFGEIFNEIFGKVFGEVLGKISTRFWPSQDRLHQHRPNQKKKLREKNFRAEGPKIFFESRMVPNQTNGEPDERQIRRTTNPMNEKKGHILLSGVYEQFLIHHKLSTLIRQP